MAILGKEQPCFQNIVVFDQSIMITCATNMMLWLQRTINQTASSTGLSTEKKNTMSTRRQTYSNNGNFVNVIS